MKPRFSFSVMFLLISSLGLAQTGIPVSEMSHCDDMVNNFLNTYDIPGATFAMARNGKLVYARGFGNADIAGQELTQPHHLFRIASVSKPITSIAVMKLIEDGQLNLSDKVFGPNGLLANHPYLSTVNYTDARIDDITVQHLLEHSCGWNRDVACISGVGTPYPWNFTTCDPIVFPLYINQLYGGEYPVKEEALIRFLMEQGLEFDPGTQSAYSNIGYLTIGLVIEEITGKSYEAYVQDEVLAPIGICDMFIGKNLLEDKREREGEYIGNGGMVPSAYNTGQNVPWEYGGWNLEAMDAHGGWIATPRDLVRLLVAVDGFNTKPDILSPASIQTMTTPSDVDGGYSLGWSVNAFDNWWHTGALDGTASIWVRASNGFTWAMILNKRAIGINSTNFWVDLDNLPWNCLSQTNTFPTHDLFDIPLQASTDLVLSPVAATPGNYTINWTSGSGDKRMLVAKAGSPVDQFPLDGMDYTANSTFGMGDDLGDGNFVVYNSGGNGGLIQGLDEGTSYYFRLFEYHKRTNNGDHALYNLCESAIISTDEITSREELAELGVRIFPNPGRERVQLAWEQAGQLDRVELWNMQGQLLKRLEVQGTSMAISTAEFPTGMYLISGFRDGTFVGSQRWLKY